VFLEDAAREFLDLAEGEGLEPACPLKAQAEAADAAEKVEDPQLAHASHPNSQSAARAPVVANPLTAQTITSAIASDHQSVRASSGQSGPVG